MAYRLFQELFPEMALTETRAVIIPKGDSWLPADEYGLFEAYCDEEDCDCRRVFFNVVSKNNVLSKKQNDVIAVVSYGWESEAFYTKWYGGEPDNETERLLISEMRGLNLEVATQLELAPAILKLVAQLLEDPAYVASIERHYQMFKEKVDPKHFPPSGAKVSQIGNPTYADLNKKFSAPSSRKPRKRRRS
jgi:hypothetical protein